MSELEVKIDVQKLVKENDLYSREVVKLLSEGGIVGLISQYKNISRRLDSVSDKNRELKTRISELEAELEGKETEFEISITPIEVANYLINHTTHADAVLFLPERDVCTFDASKLEQIAEHLLVYCKHNRESE